eukprot:scaffold61941_cov57-Phaeocystis_antarctica.AAC.4
MVSPAATQATVHSKDCACSKARLARVSSRPAWDPVCWSGVRALCVWHTGGCEGSAGLGSSPVCGIRVAVRGLLV